MELITFENDQYFKLTDHDEMRPFLMSIVSDSNHWMFLSSNGGLTAGRKNSELALFPYYTVDKLHDSYDITGSKTVIKVLADNGSSFWEPFSFRFKDAYRITRNLYKSVLGNKVVFEEINQTLGLAFRYQWCNAKNFGFVKKAYLKNLLHSKVTLECIDGLQNLMPFGVGAYLQNNTSNLVDAYKRSELLKPSGLGIYALSSIISDKAEPSEALKATLVWSAGFSKPKYLLSAQQLENFRQNLTISEELDIKGERGAYLVFDELTLEGNQEKSWLIVANVNQNHNQAAKLATEVKYNTQDLIKALHDDIEDGNVSLKKLVGSADGFILSADERINARHYANVLFNIMRGGIFDTGYTLEKTDFVSFLSKTNKKTYNLSTNFLNGLGDNFDQLTLNQKAEASGDANLIRICQEYLPIKFSRRHGDPSRPWNAFSIDTHSEVHGEKILSYEGNWRDIFQNWEALALSYPGFLQGMVYKFLNASTFDGYNPYRVTKDGYDWEVIEPDNPWSYIGYWGDHQVIYLLKFLEAIERFQPNQLETLFNKEYFVYAAVPYKIKSYDEILQNPKDTIVFDEHWDTLLRQQREEIGFDGTLLINSQGTIHQVSFFEKVIALTLSKLSNLILGGGIWMNTQRPEWNDANNALVGNGVSVVTLCYLNRFLVFFKELLAKTKAEEFKISSELTLFLEGVLNAFKSHTHLLAVAPKESERKSLTDALGRAASAYRWKIYNNGFEGSKVSVAHHDLLALFDLSLQFVQVTLAENKRADSLYNAYNILSIENDQFKLSTLDEMLEGQVAAISSGCLSANEVLVLLDNLRNSRLYREDQDSYILYPDRSLPGFMHKNVIPEKLVKQSVLLTDLINAGNNEIVTKDINGYYHFNGDFKNQNDLYAKLALVEQILGKAFSASDKAAVADIFESVFNHKAFTGRSGTFFAYEGLGSIYWHMVSKLHLAVQEVCQKAIRNQEDTVLISKLLEHYKAIGNGIGVHKHPKKYGSFPTDPYSHTPKHRGVQQPGMTGQVKEDIITKLGELGIWVNQGVIEFNPSFLTESWFLDESQSATYVDVNLELKHVEVPVGSLFFTYCNVPFLCSLSQKSELTVRLKDGEIASDADLTINHSLSKKIFNRTGEVAMVEIFVNKSMFYENKQGFSDKL
jgi:hypothetical protein